VGWLEMKVAVELIGRWEGQVHLAIPCG
jgi:hypothetical protein